MAWGGDLKEVLSFRLLDSHGRWVESGDFLGAPVLVLSGACW
jgi:hypothetical protein